MTYYSKFDTSIQCEERMEVSPEEQAEVFRMMADQHTEPQDFEGYAEWLNSLETDELAGLKDWTGKYSNSDEGPTYNGIAI